MGVQNLWSILAPVQCHKPLSELKGQVIAVDLSIWVCESQGVKQMQARVLKPFLRNLFFRITNLTQLGIQLIFVIEGEAPELKCETMMRRQKSQYRGKSSRTTAVPKFKKTGRSHFKARLKECCEMLDYLGIPWVQSKGEAEAMCAFLNINGLVDACITQDGDVFLYGARVVYRNFTLNNKDPHIDYYCMNDIETKLGLNQNSLVGLGILLGCDYLPKGVPGVGKEGVMKLMKALDDDVDVLQRFNEWHQGFPYQSVAERDVMRKALAVPGFPNQAVIEEFLVLKDKHPTETFNWSRPSLPKIKTYNQVKLDWPEEYTEEKVLPMISCHDMNQIIEHGIENCSMYLKPAEIVKTRVRQGVQCVEVHWERQDLMSSGDEDKAEFYTTVEKLDQFNGAFPEVVKSFMDAKKSKTKTKTKKSSAITSGCGQKEEITDVDSLIGAVGRICLTESNDISTEGIQMIADPKSKGSMNSKKESKRHYTKEYVDVPGNQYAGLLKEILTASDVNYQQILQSYNGNQHEKELKMSVTEVQHLSKEDFDSGRLDYLYNNDRRHEGHWNNGNEPLISQIAEMKLRDEKISKFQRRTESSRHDNLIKKRGSCKNLKSSKTNFKQNNKASCTSSSVIDCKLQTRQFKDDDPYVDLEDSWFEDLLLHESRRQKKKSDRVCKDYSDKTLKLDKIVDEDDAKYKNCQKGKTSKCQEQLVEKTGSKREVLCREDDNKVQDEELTESEVLPLCERLMMKSVSKKNNRRRKGNQKDVKKAVADSEIKSDSSLLNNFNSKVSKQFEEENSVAIYPPKGCTQKCEVAISSAEAVDNIPGTKSRNTDSIDNSVRCAIPHQSNSDHFLLFDILNENESGEILTNEAISGGAGKINMRKINSVILENKNTSLCAHDTDIQTRCFEVEKAEYSILADDTKLGDFTDLDLSTSFRGLDNTSCEVTPNTGSSNRKKTFPQKTEQVDISFEGQIQKDFPGLFNCTLPPLLTGGELFSPVPPDREIAKSVLSDVAQSPNHDKNQRDIECSLFTKRNAITCHKIVESHVQIAESPEPISLADRLKQRLGNCIDVKTLQTMKNEVKVQQTYTNINDDSVIVID